MLPRVKILIELSRPFTLLAPAVGVLCGAAVAVGETGAPLKFSKIAMAVSAACILNAASNALNQLCDIEIDRVNKPRRPLPSDRLTQRDAAVFSALLFATALALALAVNIQFFAVCLAASLLTFAYSAPPLRLKRFPFVANITIAVPRGALIFAAGWSVAAGLDHPLPWTIGGILALFVLGAFSSKDFADIKGDSANSVRTLPVLFGARKTVFLMSPFLIFPFLLIPVFVRLGLLRHNCIFITPLALYGLAIAVLLIRNPESLSTDANHPAWKHVYLLLMAALIAFAAAYNF